MSLQIFNIKQIGFLALAMLILCWVYPASTAMAQQGTEAERSLLPEIDPQDIEIRSEFRANFRGLDRQPILGFNPEPRVYQIDANRPPYIESEEERMADLPVIQLRRPTPPQMNFFSYPARGHFYSETGFGSYISPEARWFAGMDINEKSSATATLDYHSSGGHLSGDYGAFRDFNGELGYQLNMEDAGRLTMNMGGENNFNNMFLPRSGWTGDTRNEFSGGHIKAQYENWQNDYHGWSLSAAYDLFEARSSIGPVSERNQEHVGRTQFSYQWTGNRVHEIYRVDVRGQLGQFNAQLPTSDNWYKVGADFTYQRLLNSTTFLSGTIGVQGAGEPNGGQLLYPTSTLKAKHWFGDNFSLKARLEARMTSQTFKSRYDDNPFLLAMRPNFAHTYKTGGSLQAEYRLYKQTFVELKGSYYFLKDHAFHANRSRVAAALGGYSNVNALSSYYQTFYEDARVGTARFTITHDLLPETFWIEIGGFVRTHELTGGSSRPIPFKSNYGMESRVFVKPISFFRIELWGEYQGPRRNADDTNDLQSYFLAGSTFEYQINDRLGAFVKGKNVLDEQYQVWEGYEARPLQLYGGIVFSL